MKEQPAKFGELLGFYRARANITQQQFAALMNVSRNSIANWETSNYPPRSQDLVLRLADALNLTKEEREAFILAASFSADTPPMGTVQAIQNAVERVAEANPKNIQEVAAAQAEIITSYYLNGLEQSKKSFFWSLIWGGIGSGFLLVAVSVLLLRQPTEIAYASGIGGVLVEMFAGTYLYLYKHASDQLATYRLALENMQKILLANSMCEGLSTEAKQSARIDLIRLVVTSATQLDISPSDSQKPNKSAS